MKPARRMSLRMDSLRVQTSSSDNTPCTSPSQHHQHHQQQQQYHNIPPINIISPSVSSTRLTCISPLPDLRRDSMDENFLNTLNIPVPKQFADGSSRRSSGVPESIQEMEENGANGDVLLTKIEIDYRDRDRKLEFLGNNSHHQSHTCSSITIEQRDNDGLMGFIPMEVYERNLFRTTKQNMMNNKLDDHPEELTSKSNEKNSSCFHVPELIVPVLIDKPSIDNVYTSDSMTIIDTDQQVNLFILKFVLNSNIFLVIPKSRIVHHPKRYQARPVISYQQ